MYEAHSADLYRYQQCGILLCNTGSINEHEVYYKITKTL